MSESCAADGRYGPALKAKDLLIGAVDVVVRGVAAAPGADAEGGGQELTGGRGVDVVYDAVGGETSLECLRCVAFGARFLIVGWTSTPNVARGKGLRGAPNANQLPTNLIQMKQLAVLGCPSAIAVSMDPSIRPPRLATVLKWAEDGAIDPVVSRAFPLADFRDAMRARWAGEVVGGCVLNP